MTDGKKSTGQMPSLSRRGFLHTAGGLAASAAVLGAPAILTACNKQSTSEKVDTLSVSANQVVTLDSFTEIADAKPLYELKDVASYDKGTMLFSSGDQYAAALCLGKTASPLSTCSIVTLENGAITPVLDRAVGHDQGYSIFAVFASDTLLAWVESNYLTSEWAVYCAGITEGPKLGQPVKLDEGDGEYDTPDIAVAGSTAYWIVQPTTTGSRASEDSHLKAAAGGSMSANIITSHGRFNGSLAVSGQVLTVMPRANTSSGVYYELTAIQTGTGSVVASQILPRSFKPSNAIYMNNAFAFTIPAAYDYGGGIANVGTYYPIAGNQWLRLAKQSLTPPGICNGWLFAKSGSRTVFVDTKSQRYFVVDAPDNSENYGDYSVRHGEVNTVYNYSSVRKNVETNSSEEQETTHVSSVLLRSIKLRV